MFDIAWTEMALVAAVVLIVIGPKDLPKVLRQVGIWVRKLRSLAGEFQRNIDDMVREAELDEVKRQVERAGRTNIAYEAEKLIDPTGEVERSLRIDAPAARSADEQPQPATEPPQPAAGEVAADQKVQKP